MELVTQFIDIVLHLDQHLAGLVAQYGTWVYGILFLIIFCETGLIVTPFLPGDSLLFVTGALAATGSLDVHLLVIMLISAALLGDNVNYWVGRLLGMKLFQREDSKIFNRAHLKRAHDFYDRHGGKTIIIARYLPIIRTYVPFVAGVAEMPYRRFLFFSVVGAVLWVSSLSYAGYFFGNIPFVKDNLSIFIICLVVIPAIPALLEVMRARSATASKTS
ncbi:MAG TPA: DedA family protein [Burkholderiales bacterium]|nr:DedA family protein [Burkholderiales bacterium]